MSSFRRMPESSAARLRGIRVFRLAMRASWIPFYNGMTSITCFAFICTNRFLGMAHIAR